MPTMRSSPNQVQNQSPGGLGGELTSVRFAAVARRVAEASRAGGIEPPAFRSPPRSPGARRSIRRQADGSATVAVALRGRPAVAVVGDMIDGVVAAAGLDGVHGAALRDDLWSAVAEVLEGAVLEGVGSGPVRSPEVEPLAPAEAA